MSTERTCRNVDVTEPAPPIPATGEELSETCLSFTVSGEYAHFRRIEGSAIKQTYRVIPRTTVAGLVAAILGYDRDEYYEHFTWETCEIAIQPLTELRTINLPQNILATAKQDNDTARLVKSDGVEIRVPKYERPRKQRNYEVLVDPAYRIDLRLASDEVYAALKARLEPPTTTAFPVSLGQAQYLATVDYRGEHDIEQLPVDQYSLDSALPDGPGAIIPSSDGEYRMERSPAVMEKTRSTGGSYHRSTEATQSWCYNPKGGPLTIRDEPVYVDGRTVMFS